MELLNPVIKGSLANSSMIRRMFEAGIELRKKYGADKVYDFSLGNPDLPPPAKVKETLQKISESADKPFSIGYMPNAGYPALREKLAQVVSAEQEMECSAEDLLVTCGAAGGLNVFFHTVLSPGDEVRAPSPYFVEYNFYAANHGGKLIPVQSKDLTFELDIDAFRAAINERTRAIIINSPNNPTGAIYTEEELSALAEVVVEAEKKYDRAIYILADEPYRILNFDGVKLPSTFKIFNHSAVIGSFSKNLSLAGERLGYIAISPKIANRAELAAGLIMSNRILGFVNAPAIGQQILLNCLDCGIDLEIYRRRRDAMAEVLTNAGLEFTLPRGAFYFFVKSPCADEQKLVDALFNEQILVVPGRGFGRPGYIRIAFCVEDKVILNSREGFARAAAKLRG